VSPPPFKRQRREGTTRHTDCSSRNNGHDYYARRRAVDTLSHQHRAMRMFMRYAHEARAYVVAASTAAPRRRHASACGMQLSSSNVEIDGAVSVACRAEMAPRRRHCSCTPAARPPHSAMPQQRQQYSHACSLLSGQPASSHKARAQGPTTKAGIVMRQKAKRAPRQ